ncbi:putative quinate permease [Glarea lozoyensis 74030]|uniref:Quinate transporter n=1 Tax=Glarea lozoyensis (strain ATCC 74030 / MF5533) TaxID=1104152 RepID=H0EJ69_GLAL7|nr:putative quinate permease [Glarea lozoyensis 74030]
MLGANGDRGLGLIYGGRVLAGIGVGGASNLTPIYISELAPPAIRGRLVGLYEMGWQLGGVVGFWINYGVSTTMPENHSQWIIPFAVQLIPAGLMFIGLFFIKESPRWLMTRGKRDLALKNLCWIRKLDTDDMYMLEEVAAIDAGLEYQQSTVGLGFWQPFKSLWNDRKVMYRFFLGCSLFFWQNASGINAINYYSPTVFRSIGLTGTNTSLLTTGIFGVIKAVVTLIWLFFLIDNLGRRNLLMIGALGGSICLFYVGGYIAVAKPEENPSSTISSGGISAMAFFYLWTIFYTPSWNGTPWVINSEMFPQNVRTLGQAFAAASNWFFNFLVARFTQQMFTGMGYGVYFFFASLMLCSIVFVKKPYNYLILFE